VEVEFNKKDKYERIVGKLIADQQDVNLAMIRSGFAWWYRYYRNEQSQVDQ
jgi:micrococcal nuclease